MAALRTHYLAAPAVQPKPFQLSSHLSQPVTLTREGTAATTSLIVQFHRELITAVQTHTEAVFEALKAYGQSHNPADLHKQLESIGAGWKAQVNSTIDKGINQALAAGQQHVDQQAALAGFMHAFGELMAGVSQTVTGAIQGAASAAANAAKDVGGAIASAAKDVGNAASSAVSSIGHFFGL